MTISLVIGAVVVLILLLVFIVAFFPPAGCNHQWEITDQGAFIRYTPTIFGGEHNTESVRKYTKLCKVCAQHEVYYL